MRTSDAIFHTTTLVRDAHCRAEVVEQKQDTAVDADAPSLDWLLALWDYLGREHAHIKLRSLAGWPLLPSADGWAYALPGGGLSASGSPSVRWRLLVSLT